VDKVLRALGVRTALSPPLNFTGSKRPNGARPSPREEAQAETRKILLGYLPGFRSERVNNA